MRVPAVLGAAVFVLAASSSCAPPAAPEPGTPALPSSPLFAGHGSYETLDVLRARLPDRSAWRIVEDSRAAPRPGCPRFDQLTFTTPASHLGFAGRLRLTLVNDRLEQTVFEPEDFAAYLDALAGTGLRFDDTRRATIPPATEVWLSDPAITASARFIGWRDRRLSDQVRRWIERCS